MTARHVLFVDANEPGIATLGLAKRMGHRVTFVRSTEHVLFHHSPENLATLDSLDRVVDVGLASDPEQLTAAVASVHRADPIDTVITQSGFCVEATAVMSDALGLPFTSLAGVRHARNKAVARELLAGAGLASARYALVSAAEQIPEAVRRVGCPMVVKPAGGENSMLAYRVDTAEEAHRVAAGVLAEIEGLPPLMRDQFTKGVLLEEHLAGDLVSAEIGAVDGVYHRFMLSGRIRARHNECVELGAFMPSRLDPDQADAYFAYAEKVCAALGLDLGIFHVEMIATRDGPVLVEANPRLMGGVMPSLYGHVTGFDIRRDLVELHVARTLPSAPRPPRRFVTTRKVMPAEDGTLRAELDLSRLRRPGGPVVDFEDYLLRPGTAVQALSILGRFQVAGEDPDTATETADALLHEVQAAVGVPLVH